MRILKTAVAAWLFCLWPMVASAQMTTCAISATPCVVGVGQAFSAQFDDTQTPPPGASLVYHIYVNGAKVADVPQASGVGGVFTVPMAAIVAPGVHKLKLSAQFLVVDPTKFVCAAGVPDCEVFAPEMTINVTNSGSPTVPRNFRIVIVVSVGAGGNVIVRQVTTEEIPYINR